MPNPFIGIEGIVHPYRTESHAKEELLFNHVSALYLGACHGEVLDDFLLRWIDYSKLVSVVYC